MNKVWIEKGLGRFTKKIRSGILEKLIKGDVKE